MTAPLMALSLPLLDVGLAITRRLLRKQPIFTADRGHIHHRLLDRGMSPKKAVVLLYGICSIVALFSLFESVVHNNAVSSVIVLLFCAVAWIGIQYLEYAEFSLAGKMIFGGGFQRNLKAQLDLAAMQKAIAGARTAADCAGIVQQTCGQFGVVPTHMRLAGEDFTCPPEPASVPWEVRVALTDGDWIDFVRVPDSGTGAALFLDALSSSLRTRVPALAKPRAQAAAGSTASGTPAASAAR
jgi:UDP-GlcNAc:undecaprenyl-phosphate GlcNAc-1-phosphate transferase